MQSMMGRHLWQLLLSPTAHLLLSLELLSLLLSTWGAAPAPLPPLPAPPLGYSTWQWFPGTHWGKGMGQYTSVDETTCRAQADAMVATGLVAKGYTVFVVDEPCFAGRDTNGELIANSTRWPSGFKAFGEYLTARGMLFGIYTDAGPHTCQGCVGSAGHEEQDMATFLSWNVSYVKASRPMLPAIQALFNRFHPALTAYNPRSIWSFSNLTEAPTYSSHSSPFALSIPGCSCLCHGRLTVVSVSTAIRCVKICRERLPNIARPPQLRHTGCRSRLSWRETPTAGNGATVRATTVAPPKTLPTVSRNGRAAVPQHEGSALLHAFLQSIHDSKTMVVCPAPASALGRLGECSRACLHPGVHPIYGGLCWAGLLQ